jgi:hypothetical protein
MAGQAVETPLLAGHRGDRKTPLRKPVVVETTPDPTHPHATRAESLAQLRIYCPVALYGQARVAIK